MLNYQVKVFREKTYLWGGSGIDKDFGAAFYLFCRVDEFGETVELSTEGAAGQTARYGTLRPNETYIIPLRNISGVTARTTSGIQDSIVRCSIIAPD